MVVARLDRPPRRGRLHGFIGDIVRRRDDQLFARAVDQRLEQLGHRRGAHHRSRADNLGRKAVRRRPARDVATGIDRRRPHAPASRSRTGSDSGGDRTLETHHDVDPGGVLGLDPELGIGAVLAAAIGDAIVDDQDLAVVAQIDRPRAAQQRVADRQGAHHLNPASAIRFQCIERISRREPKSSAMARQVTPRAAARSSAATICRPLLSGSQM
jgi:hypothetical protein